MRYKDQLVLTGKINDVGAYTRINIPNSYRTGIELQGTMQVTPWLHRAANLTLSQNKVLDIEEYIDDYDNGGQKINHYPSANIAYSPAITGGANLDFGPFSGTVISLISKYVSRQNLDNTGNTARSLDPFFVQDLRISYTIKTKKLKELNLIGQLNNVFNNQYEPNGYTFSYIYGGQQTTENYYFPMAGINYMIGLNIRL
jgi:iron complex outermembrane receptor protein